ncbi:MAG: exodeoxyribonuclease I [Xanthomonadales bacterium]|nr:exodeoxyribonuclease I [Xanthomonadales bacterium]
MSLLPPPPAPQAFLWYDLETFGMDPRRSRIAQFAAVRTDPELRPLGEPLSLLCRLHEEVLPAPEACLVTGITPQRALREGLPEPEFARQIAAAMGGPGLCIVGFNSLRFDDEFLRHLFYRCFHDPYAREWEEGNSRWDLLDLTRLAYCLRPEGIRWPRREDGVPSFRLEDLARENGIGHRRHDALGDVLALLGLARLLREAQPRLWDYYLGLRDRRRAEAMIGAGEPLFYVSGRYPARRGGAAIVLPMLRLDRGERSWLVFDLAEDPQPLLDAGGGGEPDAATLAAALATLPPHAIKRLRPNRIPALVRLAHVRDDELARLGLDRAACLARSARLRPALPRLARALRALHAPQARGEEDAELALYQGFPPDADRALFPAIRAAPPERLRDFAARLADPRLGELLFRYRARHHPESLDAAERERWSAYRERRLRDPTLSEVTAEAFLERLRALRQEHADPAVRRLLDELEAWAGMVGAAAAASPPPE